MAETTFILQEEESLKAYISDITVADNSNPARPVQVWYRDPEMEFRTRQFPFLTVDLIDISESQEDGRHNNGRIKVSNLPYVPPGAVLTQEADHTYLADRPMPVNLDFQVTSHARTARHDRQMWARLLQKFPGRWGALPILNDGTARSMFLLGSNGSADMDAEGKRLFRHFFTVRVLSEMWETEIRSIHDLISVEITLELPLDVSITVSELDCHEPY